MGLRSSLGMPRADIEAAWGRPMRESAVTDLAAAGLIETVGDRLRLTPAGRLVADRVALELSLPGS
jgi:oxygen-independent coproporphyrinogen-3 oxidase